MNDEGSLKISRRINLYKWIQQKTLSQMREPILFLVIMSLCRRVQNRSSAQSMELTCFYSHWFIFFREVNDYSDLCMRFSQIFCDLVTLTYSWTNQLGGPHPPIWCLIDLSLLYFFLISDDPVVTHTMFEVMNRLQHADIINDKEHFLVLTEEDFASNQEEKKNIVAMANWSRIMITVFRWSETVSSEHGVKTSPGSAKLVWAYFSSFLFFWIILLQMVLGVLRIICWSKCLRRISCWMKFSKIDFWVQITEWYSSWIGKKLLGYLKDFHSMQLRAYWNSKKIFYRMRIFVPVDKPFRRFLRAGPSVTDEYGAGLIQDCLS